MDKENPKTILTLKADDELKKLILQKDAFSILKYIRNNQVHASSITKEEIARYMDEKQICSRPTTLKLIQRLLDNKIILNDKRRDNTFSSLIINPSFDFRGLVSTMLKSDVNEILKIFDMFIITDDKFVMPTGDQVKELHNYFDEAITEHYRQIVDPFTHPTPTKKKEGKVETEKEIYTPPKTKKGK